MTKISTGDRKQQLGQALRVLGWLSETREGYTKDDIALRLGVHPRTVSRLITALGDAGFIVHNTEGEGRKRFWVEQAIRGAFTTPSAEELAALSLVLDALTRDGSPHAAHLTALSAKLTIALQLSSRRALGMDLDELARRQRIAPSPGPIIENDPTVISLIQTAIKAGCCIKMDYQSCPKAPVKQHVVEPWGLLLGRVCHLVGRYVDGDERLFNFRVDRIASAQLSSRPAIVPEAWTLDERLAQSVGVFTGDAQDIILRVRAHGVTQARQWRFHPRQTTEEQGDELLIRFHAGGLRELAEHLFTWGDKIRIEAPDALRNEMRERLALAAHTL